MKDVIRNYDSKKILGPDGFNIGFFKKCWEVIKDDLLNSVS